MQNKKVNKNFFLGGGVLVKNNPLFHFLCILRPLNPFVLKIIISTLFLMFLSLSTFSQGIQNLKLSYGNNVTDYKTGFLERGLLPNNTVAEDLKINSFSTSGFSFGATLGFAISKDKKWMFHTGLFYQNFDLETSIYAYSEGNDYIFRRATKVNQLELPFLVSWRNSKNKFRYGADLGMIKPLFIWSKYTESSFSSGVEAEPGFSSYDYNLEGAVNLLEKYSLYFAPTIGYDFTKKLGIEFQPYIRYQVGNSSEAIYSHQGGAPVLQYGINLNLVKYF